MTRILYIILTLLLCSFSANAQSIKDIIREMPDSILPTLSRNTRLDFIDYLDAGQKAEERNLLRGTSEMTHLSNTRAVIKTSSASSVDIKLLNNDKGHIAIITTVQSDKIFSSVVKYYSADWQLVRTYIPEGFRKLEWNDDNEEIKETVYNPLELKTEL